MTRNAGFTVVSKNYLALAATLASSWRRHHPERPFYIILADKHDEQTRGELFGATRLIEIDELGIPDFGSFVYRYSILELNTAVKPFAFRYLFGSTDHDAITYLDPDILVFQPMVAADEALANASIALIPHTRSPYYDACQPSEVRLLQSGTFNLGFVALRRGKACTELIEWWQEKLFADCRSAIQEGLFVDQKWMDLVPSYFPDLAIIRDPAYNAAYWNLHERTVSCGQDGYLIDGEPLVFFHFSGYDLGTPSRISKHQDRHDLELLPDVRRLFDEYSTRLIRHGHESLSGRPYAFERLPNGVLAPAFAVRDVIQLFLKHSVDFPDPQKAPDEFCRFLFKREVFGHTPLPPFHYGLQQRFPNHMLRFPGAKHDEQHPEYVRWLKDEGLEFLEASEIFAYQSPHRSADRVAEVFYRLRSGNPKSLFELFEGFWFDDQIFEGFAQWMTIHGSKHFGLNEGHTEALLEARKNLRRLLGFFLSRQHLRASFTDLRAEDELTKLEVNLRTNRLGHPIDASLEDISLFVEFVRYNPHAIELMRLCYGQAIERDTTLFSLKNRLEAISSGLSLQDVFEWFAENWHVSIRDQALIHVVQTGEVLPHDAPEILALPHSQAERARRVFAEAHRNPASVGAEIAIEDFPSVNLLGYFDALTGIGMASRSMRHILSRIDVEVAELTVPTARDFGPIQDVQFLGGLQPFADFLIAVCNADSTTSAQEFSPQSAWTPRRKRIGQWVWESDLLPPTMAVSEQHFDEIWVPSAHTAKAVRQAIDLPVKIVPYRLNFDFAELAVPDRARFGLPEEKLLYGFMLDPHSILERKNVAGLLAAFREALGSNEDARLVIKINGTLGHDLESANIRAAIEASGAIVILEKFSSQDVFNFLSSLDVYVSLHRAEGFGLTCAEAMSVGTPVIATGYSGNLYFMNEENSALVDFEIIETQRPFGAYPAGTRWADPDLHSACDAMRRLQDSQARHALGQRGKTDVREMLHVNVIAPQVAKLLDI